MKKISFIICFLFLMQSGLLHAQHYALATDCENATQVCKSSMYIIQDCDQPPPGGFWLGFELSETGSGISFGFTGGVSSYTLYGPFNNVEGNCDLLLGSVFDSLGMHDTDLAFDPLPAGSYVLVFHPASCIGTFTLNHQGIELDCNENTSCENCIGSFAPEAGKKYLISAWVREEDAALDVLSFSSPKLGLGFNGGVPTSAGPFTASGLIIDGWQRIEEEFTIPVNTKILNIQLICETGNCLFDDIRVLPYDGSMKTYVYDPITLRLVAELDERHYTTFYEYDEEGKLVRIKKETEKGIMTIQESKTGVVKQ